ncbi:hypothetical protein AURDEDRAFT_76207 [Auricularia subglabra TFB-10046 SS5]|uniref:Uncharacterized protein n=1 Tax=Auricularia subglabra (strain TFB-10046 / SS5) TaxID=717982 RepID=J0WR42_AURST|nr:hypothetical protein AURDEDRAFT_76207 [Auricularia subglabra TFB-10046 SS5]
MSLSDSSPLLTLSRSRRVSRKWKTWLNVTLRQRYDYDKFLANFFPTADARLEFRSLQACHGAMISGSRVLDFLGRFGFATGSDTDIYATLKGVKAIGRFLLSRGFVYQGQSWSADIFDAAESDEDYPSCDVVKVFKFEGPSMSTSPCKIDLVLVVDSPLSTILRFHTSTFRSRSPLRT